MTMKTVSESQLFDNYRAAQQAYDDACREESIARSARTDALNKLNAAQKAIRAHMDQLMQEAPSDSDWKREHRNNPSTAV